MTGFVQRHPRETTTQGLRHQQARALQPKLATPDEFTGFALGGAQPAQRRPLPVFEQRFLRSTLGERGQHEPHPTD